jgi:hypothetical protein
VKLKIKETEIVNNICEYLTLKKYFFFRMNNIPVFNKERGCFRKFPKWCVKGVPDIFVLKTDKTIGLEVKSLTGTWGEEQKMFKAFFDSRLANREYHVVRSVEDVMKVGL